MIDKVRVIFLPTDFKVVMLFESSLILGLDSTFILHFAYFFRVLSALLSVPCY